MKAKLSITALRKKYPHPVRGFGAYDGQYCVGGALCRAVGLDIDFPVEQKLKEAVLKANPRIDWYAISTKDHRWAYSHIRGVLEANDVGNFDLAWSLLGELLCWKPKAFQEKSA